MLHTVCRLLNFPITEFLEKSRSEINFIGGQSSAEFHVRTLSEAVYQNSTVVLHSKMQFFSVCHSFPFQFWPLSLLPVSLD